MRESVILFDGVCNMCSGAVRFIFKRDPGGVFRFAFLQSETGKDLLEKGGLRQGALDTFVLIEHGRYYTKSTAALRVARRLRGLWPLLFALIAVPRPIRDAVYGWIAANRYRWFGRKSECTLPSPELKQRFLA
jgi:predicted DCC family thiol-disulfide oxidoreductase YuxK